MDQQSSTGHGANCNCAGCKMMNNMPPKMAFFAGVITTLGVVFAAGFIVLLVMMVKGVSLTGTGSSAVTAPSAAAAAPTNVNTAAAPTQPTAATQVDMSKIRNIRGKGSVTVVEASDLECPFCKQFHPTMQQLLQNYDGKVSWGFINLPLPSLHPKAPHEAVAAECAADQGKFWDYIDEVYAKTPGNNGLDPAQLTTFAQDQKLDMTKFNDCLTNNKTQSRVDSDSALATSYGATGTPFSLVVNTATGKVCNTIPGALPYDQVKQIVDTCLSQVK